MNIRLKRSQYYPFVFWVLVCFELGFILLLPMHYYCKLIGSTILIFSAMKAYHTILSRNLLSLTKLSKNLWQLHYLNGHEVVVKLRDNSIITSFFCILILKSSRNLCKKPVLLFKDSMTEREYHLLRLHLKGLLSE